VNMATTLQRDRVNTRSPQRRRRARDLISPQTRAAYLFLSPWIIGFAVFTAGAMVASFYFSFTDYDVINPPKWAGGANYSELLHDPVARRALLNTFYYTVVHVPLATAIALGLAMLLHRIARLRGLFRTLFYLPSVTPAVAVGVLFLLILNGQTGILNRGLGLLGIPGPGWTTENSWIMPGIILMSLWSVGGTMVIFLAALNNVPLDLHEAAAIDGASPWRRFRTITLPMISGAMFFTVITNTIASLQMFTQVYTMYFGSVNARFSSDAAQLYLIYLFQSAFAFLRMGYASAMAWILFVIILIVTLIQLKVGNRLVYLEGEDA
jgi:multiple sugar transport system permease protein